MAGLAEAVARKLGLAEAEVLTGATRLDVVSTPAFASSSSLVTSTKRSADALLLRRVAQGGAHERAA